MYNMQSIRDEAKCQGHIREVNFRETDTQFVYRGSRGIVIIDKGDDRAGAYLAFINELRRQFEPSNIYHQIDASRFDVPELDADTAPVFLSIVDDTEQALADVS